MKPSRDALALFAISLLACVLFNYGGIRTPDGEIAFRTASALARNASTSVDTELGWKGFGLATGRDGARYSIFGPLLPVLAAPVVIVGEAIARTAPFAPDDVPVSFYIGAENHIFERQVRDPAPHTIRFVASHLNALASATSVALLCGIAFALSGSRFGAWVTALAYGLGSIALPHASLFMGEPLAALFSLASFALLLRASSEGVGDSRAASAGAGLLLGLATLAHITAILFAPFFAAALWFGKVEKSGRLGGALAFGAGLALPLLWLGAFNYARFGNPLETGRTMPGTDGFGYGVFVSPFGNLPGLLFGLGKGLLPFSPVVLLALPGVRAMWRERPALVWALAAAALFRIVFIAARSDWHGGFSIGPRYLVILVPFLLLPLAYFARDLLATRSRIRAFGLVGALLACILQQFYFSMGDIVTYSHMIRVTGGRQGMNVFANDFIYLGWEVSPLHRLHEAGLGSFALRETGLDFASLSVLLGVVATVGLGWQLRRLAAREATR